MKLDLKKIVDIKSKTDLSKFEIDKPLFYNNYLFHYLIIFDKLDILQLDTFPIYKENDEGLNGFFLAAKYDNIEILKFLIKNYNQYVYNRNQDNEIFIDYLKYSNILKIIDCNLNWKLLFENKLDDILYNFNYADLIKLFKKYKPLNHYLHMIIMNPKLNEKEIISILDLFINEINLRDQEDQTLIFPALHNNNIKIIKYLISKNVDIDYYTIVNTYHPLKTAIFIGFMDAYDLIWNHIKSKFNYELTNKNLENIAHFLLQRGFTDKTSFEILTNSPSSIWHQLNTNKQTPIELIILYDFIQFNNILKNKQVNIDYIKDKFKNHKNKNTELWIDFLEKLPKYEEENDIIVDKYSYAHSNMFQSKFTDMSFYILHLCEKYKNLYFPNIINYKLTNITDLDEINLNWPDQLLDNDPIFAWIICYQSEDEYWVHTDLNNLINAQRRNKKHDFGLCYLSIRTFDGGLHANIIIYDFNNLTIERFDPYGDSVNFDNKLDEILEEELTWNTGFKYLKPSDYMPVGGFQTISDELNSLKQKNGDFGGYCLAWCNWYLEHRIKNIHVKPNELVKKLIKKLSTNNCSFMEIIRNYANKLNNTRTEHLLKAGINENIISNITLSKNNENKIEKYIIHIFTNKT